MRFNEKMARTMGPGDYNSKNIREVIIIIKK
jgi:hypothetical protein